MVERLSPFTPDDKTKLASRLVLRSFHLSRGYPPVQHLFLRYTGSAHPENVPEDLTDARAFCVAAASRFISRGGHVRITNTNFQADPAGVIGSEIDAAFVSLRIGSMEPTRGDVSRQAPSQILASDVRWIPYSEPSEKDIPMATAENGYRSNFVDFALIGRDAGMEEVNEFYAASRKSFKKLAARGSLEGYMGVMLQDVVAAHLSYNPEDTVDLANAAKAK